MSERTVFPNSMKNILNKINEAVKSDPEAFISECDGAYASNIQGVAERIAADDNIKIVAIAGPSSAGKTTTAHLLCESLEAMGEKTDVVSLDDFYLPPGEHPLLPDGSPDLESVHALDIPLIKKCFEDIIATGKTVLPSYDFKSDARIAAARMLDIGDRGIVIAEGLHALNPLITGLVPKENIFKIYISVNCDILDNSGNKLLSSRQIRLIRRTLRDSAFRGADVNETLGMWSNVVEGESKYLYCFKDSADVKLVTLHPYEPCLYKDAFCALEQSVAPSAPCREYFQKTVDALGGFVTLDRALIPKNSLIREFIGQE